MIDQSVLTAEGIKKIASSLGKADPILVEKVTRALLLLEGLCECGASFVFKGGTAVMLLLKEPRRFSIDIDIICEKTQPLLDCFPQVVSSKGFLSFTEQERKSRDDLVKHHYKFAYKPVASSYTESDNILLDIVVKQSEYISTKTVAVSLPFLPQDGAIVETTVPSVDSILGDKLTAFAPETTGIPYKRSGNSMAMEICKQLYDIGCLFNEAEDVSIIKSVFEKTARVEIGFRRLDILPDEVLEDIFQTALCISTRGVSGRCQFEELQSGIKSLGSFIFSEKYQIEKAITHASKAAYLSSLVRTGENKIVRFENAQQVVPLSITDTAFNKLNKLKKSNPEAFFYWYQAVKLRGEDGNE